MKKIIIFTVIILSSFLSFSQIPQSFKYQAVLRNNEGNILESQNVEIRFSIVWNNPDGIVFYSELHQTETNQYGLITLNIGEGDVISGNFEEIPWGYGTYFLKSEMNIGNGFEFVGCSQLLSVPYALNAGNVTLTSENGTLYNLTVDNNGNLSAQEILIDQDGNIYKTVKIGNQVWMAENLRTGVMIDSLVEPTDNGIIEKYYFRNNTQIGDSLGGLYKWNEVMNYSTQEGTQGICPAGWHIPTQADWDELIAQFPQDSAGYYLQPQGGSGFNALLNGNFYNNEFFIDPMGLYDDFVNTIFLTSSTNSNLKPFFYEFSLNNTYVSIYNFDMWIYYGGTMRCIKNQTNNKK